MSWPSDSGTIPSDMQGTLILADPTDDHALMHRKSGTILNALPTVFGTTPGTNLLRGVANASDQLFSLNSGGTANTMITKGTANNMIFGTPSVTGGTLVTPVINGGTAGTLVGTATTNNLAANWLNVSNATAVKIGSESAPTAGQVLTATAGSAATWQAAVGFATSGTQADSNTTSASLVDITGGSVSIVPTRTVNIMAWMTGDYYDTSGTTNDCTFALLINGTNVHQVAYRPAV